MTIEREAQLVDILGWLWLAAVILALVFGNSTSLAVVAGIGVAAAAGYFGYKFWRRPELFRGKGP